MIDFTKPVYTRNGKPVRILCTDGPNAEFPVIGIIEGCGDPETWMPSGQYGYGDEESPWDLRNAQQSAVLYLAIENDKLYGPDGPINAYLTPPLWTNRHVKVTLIDGHVAGLVSKED